MALSLPPVAVVIPARNEAGGLPLLLADLAFGHGLISELVVVDGGSSDGTTALARLAGARVLHSPPGRGQQLIAGINATSAPWLWLLHADVRLPRDWSLRLQTLLDQATVCTRKQPEAWFGELQVAIASPQYRLLELLVALRSRLLQCPYGDQGLLLRRSHYLQTGGLQPLPLMEDLAFAETFRRYGRFLPMGLPLRVDGRRWRRHGLLATSWRNARLRRAWRRGLSPATLHALYHR